MSEKKLELMRIELNELIAEDTYKMVLSGDLVKTMKQPGQFLNISVGDNSMLLRRPISICEITDATATIIYKVEGNGTNEMSKKEVGESIDVMGPLGNGFPLVENKKVLLVGGGVGVPPMYELAKQLLKQGCEVTTVLGFRNKEVSFYFEEFSELSRTFVASNDGSVGTKGLVTDVITDNDIEFDVIYACGPTPMLKALDIKYKDNKEGYLSFEERMACGIGACYACVCKTNTEKGHARVCKEGPVFKLGSVSYE